MPPDGADRCLAAELHPSARHPGAETHTTPALRPNGTTISSSHARQTVDKLRSFTDADRLTTDRRWPCYLEERKAPRLECAPRDPGARVRVGALTRVKLGGPV